MKSSKESTSKVTELGSAIARGMEKFQAQKEMKMAKEAVNQKKSIEDAADKLMFK